MEERRSPGTSMAIANPINGPAIKAKRQVRIASVSRPQHQLPDRDLRHPGIPTGHECGPGRRRVRAPASSFNARHETNA